MKTRSELHKKQTYDAGLFSEMVAAWYLRLKGYRIVANRYKTGLGEIDIIAKKGNTLVMSEIKARAKGVNEILTSRQRERIANAASLFLAKNPDLANFNVRFDLIVIYHWGLPRHYVNAWESTNEG